MPFDGLLTAAETGATSAGENTGFPAMKKGKVIGRKKAARKSVEPAPKERVELLLEQVLDKVDAIGEGHAVLDQKIDALSARMDERFAEQDAKMDAIATTLNAKIDSVAQTQDAKIDSVGTTLNAKIDSVATTLNAKIDSVAKDLGGKMDAVARELKEHRADTVAHLAVH